MLLSDSAKYDHLEIGLKILYQDMGGETASLV